MDQSTNFRKLGSKYHDTVIAAMPGHVYWKDCQGRFLGCNDNQARAAGLEHPDQILGKTDYEMPWSIQADYLRRIDTRIMESKEAQMLEEVFELPDGTRKLYLSHKIPLFSKDGKVEGILGISFDITDRKHTEEELRQAKKMAEAANQAKTEFLENMRHDLRTPLTGIVGFANIIKEEAENTEIAEYAANLMAASHTLMDFLNDMLDAIKVLKGDLPTVKRRFSPRMVAEQIVTLLLPKAHDKQLKLSLTCDEDIPNSAVGDPVRLQRILLELTANALNFTHEGQVDIRLELAKQEGRDFVLRCIVDDTGIGIPDNMREEIFVRFKKLIPSYDGIYKGHGLGLAVVKTFVDEMGGEVYCQRRDGGGSRFICILPLRKALADDAAFPNVELDLPRDRQVYIDTPPPQSSIDATEQAGHATRVLIVEDHHIAAQVAEQVIARLNCEADIAPDAKAALDLIKDNDYDLIFMDVGLPDIDGMQLTQQIRSQEWRSDKHVPIVALTAHIDTENKEKCMESGMDAVLSKPLMPETAKAILTAFVPSRLTQTQQQAAEARGDEVLRPVTGQVFDREDGIARMGGDEQAAETMIGLLVKGFQEDLPALKAARDRGDWKVVRALVHKHRGGSVYCGTPRIHQVLLRLDNYLEQGKAEHRDALLELALMEMGKLEAVVGE